MSSKANYQNYISLLKQGGTKQTVSLLEIQVTIFIGYRKGQNLNSWFQRLATDQSKTGQKKKTKKLYFRQSFGAKTNN